MKHKEVLVKVNARCDVGVAPLVSLLSSIPYVETLQSCQGTLGKSEGYVYLRCANWRQTCALLFGKIAPAIRRHIDDESARIEVFGNDNPIGKITFQSGSLFSITADLNLMVQNP